MLFDAFRVTRGFAAVIVAIVALGAGVVAPKVLIPDVKGNVELESPEALRYIEGRMGTIGNTGQRAMRMQISIVGSRPDSRDCDWGYGEPITEILTIQTYTLWGVPLETWELSCSSSRLVGGPLSW
jgi:hypothetical protein